MGNRPSGPRTNETEEARDELDPDCRSRSRRPRGGGHPRWREQRPAPGPRARGHGRHGDERLDVHRCDRPCLHRLPRRLRATAPRPQRPRRRGGRRRHGALARPDGRRRDAGRGRAGRAPRRQRAVAREGPAHLHGQRGDVPCPARLAHGDRPPPRDQVPGLLPRLARLGRDERDLTRRARRRQGSALGWDAGRGGRHDDRLPVQRRGRRRARPRAVRRGRDHPRDDPAQHRRRPPPARLPRAAARARDEARHRAHLRRGDHRASATGSAATRPSPA